MADAPVIKSINVIHEKFGRGQTIHGQHAPLTEDGDVDWFDVLFEHGVERVPSKDLLEAVGVGDQVVDGRGRVGVVRLGLHNRLVVDYGNGQTDVHSERYWKPYRG